MIWSDSPFFVHKTAAANTNWIGLYENEKNEGKQDFFMFAEAHWHKIWKQEKKTKQSKTLHRNVIEIMWMSITTVYLFAYGNCNTNHIQLESL